MKKRTKQTTINALRDLGSAKLSRANIPMREADILLAFVLGVTETYLISHTDEAVLKLKEKRFRTMIAKRIKSIPLAYLTNKKHFFGLEFYVDERVLIPRPETETLVEKILKDYSRESTFHVADIGTGSGCIAITLAKYFPRASLYAVDTSFGTLAVAKKNAKTHRVSSHIQFKKGSLLAPLLKKKIELIVANLPYLEKHELANVPFEPVEALYGGKNGLEFIDQLINQIIDAHIPRAMLEIHPLQAPWLEMRIRHIGNLHFEFIKDLAGKPRVLLFEKA